MRRAASMAAVLLAALIAAVGAAGSAAAESLPRPVVREPREPREPLDDARPRGRRGDRLGWAVPDFVQFQSGGWLGAMNVAIGFAAAADIVNLSAGFGYTPGRVAGQDVHNADVTLVLRPLRIAGPGRWALVPELGASVMYVFGDEYHVQTPGRYPSSGYYQPTALHWLAHVGIELTWEPRGGLFTRHALFYRAAALDTFAQSWLENRDRLDLTDALSGAIGYRADF
jgi:hypothetical protein